MPPIMQATIRPGQATDVAAIRSLIQQLADFEKAPNEVAITEAQLLEDGFGQTPVYGTFVAELETQVVGMALYYTAYSTWKGKMLFLEDLIVNEAFRGQGIGKALLDTTIAHAAATGAKLVKWQVLDWNTPAIEFYKGYGASFDKEWLNVRLMEKDYPSKQ